MIPTNSEDALSEEQFLALETLHQGEAKGVPGSDGIYDKWGSGPGWTPTFLP